MLATNRPLGCRQLIFTHTCLSFKYPYFYFRRRLGFGKCLGKFAAVHDITYKFFCCRGGDDKDTSLKHLIVSAKPPSKSTSKKDASGDQAMKTKNALLTVASIFLVSLLGLAYVYFSFPQLEDHEKQHVKLPWDIEDAKKLGQVLDRYKDRYFTEVLGGIFITYIFLQTFAIPGSIFLSILSGFLFPFPIALLLVCFCSATGASLCFLLSSLVGRRVVYKYWPERAAQWAATVKKQNDNLFNYMVFLRVTPFLPNWFINIVAPVIDVPIKPFWLGTFFGVAPPSFVAIQTGKTLHQLSSSDAKFSWNSVILLAVFAVLSLIPVLVKQRLRRKFE
ncbi:transmembrane protein 41B-like isoform X2 [Thrips palmi]|uniref:Transmembrane protein 41B-like isoform X2 n=1 Tax=Thrips palmi TaxID=161013 RepID=A0A6P8Z9E2_THRPL|nr:transmembrane protein 41B-like isoform X2 [Thrips palmi]XP_034247081.1 transmembrane protein 41B-like isoform X2 [Thrips palmi]